MNATQKAFLDKSTGAALLAGHPFPQMAACEAALESAWGRSILALQGCNLFGMKQHSHPIYGTLNLPTREFTGGSWTEVLAGFVKYPDLASCFADRRATLERLANVYPHYRAAIIAADPETYIREVSKTWSTDPDRAEKVLAVYQEYLTAVRGTDGISETQ